jgi:hypothetical protein
VAAAADQHAGAAAGCRRRWGERTVGTYFSSVNPTLIVTCQCATLLPSIPPRVSRPWNHLMLRIDFEARAIAVRIASSLLLVEVPVSSSD